MPRGSWLSELRVKKKRQDKRRVYRRRTERLATLTAKYENYRADNKIVGYPRECGHRFSL